MPSRKPTSTAGRFDYPADYAVFPARADPRDFHASDPCLAIRWHHRLHLTANVAAETAGAETSDFAAPVRLGIAGAACGRQRLDHGWDARQQARTNSPCWRKARGRRSDLPRRRRGAPHALWLCHS